MKQLIFPAILSNNQKEVNRDFNKLKRIVSYLHLDVVDGKFAPNKSFWFKFKLSKEFKYLAHLMIKNPERWIERNLSKIELFIPHFEEIKDKEKYIKWMKSKKKKIAFAILPETKVGKIKSYLKEMDYILILTVHPGFYGSKYLNSELNKIPQIKKINPKIKVIVDGGMHPLTIKGAKHKGADFFVSGTYTTKADNPKQSIRNLMKAMR